MKWREFLVAVGAMVVLLAIQLRVTHAGNLLHQVPWLDEVHTAMIVNDPDPARFHAAMTNECVDSNFPVYYEALCLAHVTSLPAVRAVSLASGGLMLLGIYLLLRRAFTPIASAVGVLSAWTTPLVVYQSFQARFYMPWCAALVWFAIAVQWEKKTRWKIPADIVIGLTSFLACTFHIVGLPAVGLIVLAEFYWDTRPLARRVVAFLPALTGPIAVLAFVPLLITQRHSFHITTWLVGNPIRLVYSAIAGVLPMVAAAVLMLGLWIAQWCKKNPAAPEPPGTPLDLKPLAGISSLILLPVLLFFVSLVTQPLLLPRYLMPCVAAVAPAAAFLASRMQKSIALCICFALAAESGAELIRRNREAGDNRQELDSLIAFVHAHPDEPALFESRHQLFPALWISRDLIDRCAYISFSPGPNQLDPVVEGYERDLAVKFQTIYGWPLVIAWDKANSLPRFLLIPLVDNPTRIAARFAGYSVHCLEPKHYELVKQPG